MQYILQSLRIGNQCRPVQMQGSFCLLWNCFTSLLDKKYGCEGQPLSSDLFQNITKNARFVKESRQNSLTFNNRLEFFLIQHPFNTDFNFLYRYLITWLLHFMNSNVPSCITFAGKLFTANITFKWFLSFMHWIRMLLQFGFLPKK